MQDNLGSSVSRLRSKGKKNIKSMSAMISVLLPMQVCNITGKNRMNPLITELAIVDGARIVIAWRQTPNSNDVRQRH